MYYKKQLLSGKWQKKRLEIMQRDDFKCRVCKLTDELTVHHLYYIPELKPWEYDNEGLVTLCKRCHDRIHFECSKLAGIIAFKLMTGEFDETDLKNIGTV